jgi:acyl carrier protein
MSRVEFLSYMSEILDVPPGVLTGAEKLDDLEGWNSMAMVGFIAFADEHFGKTLSPRQFAACGTIADLGTLAGAIVPRNK